jgi:flagellar motor switch protein FliM
MADVLSQSEVDALLAAVGGGGGDKAKPAQQGTASGPAAVPAEYYDFLRPERVSAAELRALNELHELAARTMATTLSSGIRHPVQCRLQTLDQVAWGEFVAALPVPTCFGVAEVFQAGAPAGQSAAGSLALEIPYAVMFPMIDILLGGNPDESPPAPKRAITDIESRVAAAVVEMMLDALARTWQRAQNVTLKLQQLESNPQMVPVAPPTEMAALATFDLSLGEKHSGVAHLCVPLSPFGKLVRDLSVSGLSYSPAAATAAADDIRRAVGLVPVGLEACVPGPKMSLRDIVRLSAGDTIDTARSVVDEVTIFVAGVPKYLATVGAFRGRRAVQVSDVLETELQEG